MHASTFEVRFKVAYMSVAATFFEKGTKRAPQAHLQVTFLKNGMKSLPKFT